MPQPNLLIIGVFMYTAVATCAFGLESVLVFELKRIGAQSVSAADGRVTFEADERMLVRANLWLRTAERVLIILKEYRASTFDELFDGGYSIDWKSIIGKNDAFPVKGYTMNSQLTSVPACQSVLKKAIVESLKKSYDTPFLPERGSKLRIQFSIVKDTCTVMLDTSGDGLHKRGWRPLLNEAPIKETLAAGIVDLTHVRRDTVMHDPVCGSGTLVIEAAQKALNIAPGMLRSFAFMGYSFFESGLLDDEKRLAREQIAEGGFKGLGTDIDPKAIEIARENAKRAGVEKYCRFEVADAVKTELDPESLILANPPYGERLMTADEARVFYRGFCDNLNNQKVKNLGVITNFTEFEAFLGRKAGKRRKLYNGMLPCQLYMYY